MKVKRSSNRLYKILIEVSKQQCMMTKQEESSRLWHLRLGHVNYLALVLMSKSNMGNGFQLWSNLMNYVMGVLWGNKPVSKYQSRTTTIQKGA